MELDLGNNVFSYKQLCELLEDDFKNGETWVTLMERNIDVLKKALQ